MWHGTAVFSGALRRRGRGVSEGAGGGGGALGRRTPCTTAPPPPKGYGMAPTQRHMTSLWGGVEDGEVCSVTCGTAHLCVGGGEY